MSEAEQKVKAKWKHVIVCDGSYRHYAKGTVLLNWANHRFHEFGSFEDAYAFTVERERLIAEVEDEIAVTRDDVQACDEVNQHWRRNVYERILTRLQPILADLTTGMRKDAAQRIEVSNASK